MEEVDRLPQASLEPSPTVTSHDFLSYIYQWNLPLPCRWGIALLVEPVYPSPPSHTFFSGASSKRRNASRRSPSFAACCSAACCSCFCPQHTARWGPLGPAGALPGPTPGGRVGLLVRGGYGCLWWIYLQLFSCLTDLLISGPLCMAQTLRQDISGFCGKSASISKTPKFTSWIGPRARGVEP